MDARTKNLMTMNKALHPRDDIERLQVSRKEKGRELSGNKETINTSLRRLEDYIKKRKERLITRTRKKNQESTEQQ